MRAVRYWMSMRWLVGGDFARRSMTGLLVVLACTAAAQPQDYGMVRKRLNFIVCSDMGRNGYYYQRQVAQTMGEVADAVGAECVAAIGDIHHFEGVASVADPLWTSNYEQIYTHPALMVPWYPVLGNHEYRGSTQAVLDYARVSRRWAMPARYYTRVLSGRGTTVRLVWLDTTPMIDKYRRDSVGCPDVRTQDVERQLRWADSVLTAAREDWVVVMGHHPIYAETPKAESERGDMQRRLGTLLRRHRVDMYLSGHIHNFQHLRRQGDPVAYVVNSSGANARKIKTEAPDVVYCAPEAGFSLVSASPKSLELRMIDHTGAVLHTVSVERKAGSL